MDKLLKPVPEPSAMSQPYWDAAAAGRFILQSCADCGRIRHYPQLLCSHCYSDAVNWKDATGRGKVHSWTVAHHAFHPAFKADLPYTLVTVDLEEGVRALGLWQSDLELSLDLAVHGQFETREESVALVFRPLLNPPK